MLLRILRIALAAFLASSASAAALTITDREASAHMGQTVTVVGVVTGTHVTLKGTEFLDFGPRYPGEDLTAVIFASSASQFGDVNQYYGKKLAVTGTIESYKGRTEIILRSPNQLSVLH